MKVLIVEPSRFSRLTITLALERQGLFVDSVSDVMEAKAIIEQQEYQVICIARALGVEEFRTFCSQLRAAHDTQLTPIIMLTSDDEVDTESYMALGVTEIFKKTEIKALGQCIQKMFTDVSPRGGKILYVEDSVTTATVVSRELKKEHHHVTHFVSAEEAIDNYENGLYDLVLTDVVLAGKMNGIALVRYIRETETPDMIPVSILAMSAYDDTSRTLSLLQAGANDYVTKPIMAEELLARVNNHLNHHQLFVRLRAQQKRLEQLAMTDQLTGLYNRHYLEHVAQKNISMAKRHGVDLCLIVIDVDHFKKVNDQHGHTVGDVVLTHISALLSSQMRDGDIVARYGGEEFVIVLDHCPLDAAIEKAVLLRKGIEQLRPESLTVTASFGVTQYKQKEKEDFSSLFKRADEALYKAKSNGRNCVVGVR